MTKLKEAGFGLVEVTVAIGISALVILGGTNIFKSTMTSTSKKSSNSYENLNVMSRLLKGREVCRETLQGKKVMSSVDAITGKGQKFFTSGQEIGEKAVLKSMQLVPNGNWIPIPNGFGPASIKVVIENKKDTMTRFIPVSVQLNADSEVVSCTMSTEKIAEADDDIYNDVCLDVVKGSLQNNKCKWTKPTQVIVTYIPAPVVPDPSTTPTTDTTVDPNDPSLACIGPVCALYQELLGRNPDMGGKAFWEEVAANSGLDAVRAGIANSKEANGQQFDATDWANYQQDVANRGISIEQAVQRCGVDLTC